jgi:hypothetical protein
MWEIYKWQHDSYGLQKKEMISTLQHKIEKEKNTSWVAKQNDTNESMG